MNRLIACVIGGAVHQPFGENAINTHIISTDLSQIFVAASWMGTVELAIVAVVGLGLWFWERKGRRACLMPAQRINLS
jgi:hypothetical protein